MNPSAERDYVEVKQQRLINEGCRYFVVAYGDNLQWVEKEIDIFLTMWHEKIDIQNIAFVLRRPIHEIKYLITYLESLNPPEDNQAYAKECKERFNKPQARNRRNEE